MKIGDIIKWVDDAQCNFQEISFYSLAGLTSSGLRTFDKQIGYKSECNRIIYAINSHFFNFGEAEKKAFVKRVFRYSCYFFIDCVGTRKAYKNSDWCFLTDNHKNYVELLNEAKSHSNPIDKAKSKHLFNVLKYDLFWLYNEILLLCIESGLNLNELRPSVDGIDDVITDMIAYTHLSPIERDPLHTAQTPQPIYKTLPATHRRATLKLLLETLGVDKEIDKTKIAGFVEAVTGGNIDANPKNTVSYKPPTKQAKEVAKKLLSNIGIEAKE